MPKCKAETPEQPKHSNVEANRNGLWNKIDNSGPRWTYCYQLDKKGPLQWGLDMQKNTLIGVEKEE